MNATLMPHILDKLDRLRESQIRGEAIMGEILVILGEIRALMKSAPAKPAATDPAAFLAHLGTTLRAGLWVFGKLRTHGPILIAILYAKATGQDEKIWAYIGQLLGL